MSTRLSTEEPSERPLSIPDCIAVDARGFGWRVWADREAWSMVPTTDDNLPIPEPITWFARSRHGPPLAAQIRFLTRQRDEEREVNASWKTRYEVVLAQRDEARAALERVVANESNHYDRYWTPAPESLTDEWLDATEGKMREALTDAFCDDAAAVMLTLISEIRGARRASENKEPGKMTKGENTDG